MEHPLIGDISGLTIDEISTRITDLNRKVAIAERSGNGHLCNQIRMALETFNSRYRELLEQQYNKQNGGRDFSEKINIE